MTAPGSNDWDGAEEKRKLLAATHRVLPVQEQAERRTPNPLEGFTLANRAQLDGAVALLLSDCFSTRASFYARIYEMIAEPTPPTHPVWSLEAYQECQRHWLRMLILEYEQQREPSSREPDTPGN